MSFLSKLRFKTGKVSRKDGEKTENHNTPSGSNSQPIILAPPAAVKANQKPTVDEARDELTKALRGNYSYNKPAQGVTKGLDPNFLQVVHFLKCIALASRL